MSAILSRCPHCQSEIAGTSRDACPGCGRPLRDQPTCAIHDLNTTTDYGISRAGSVDEVDKLVGTQLANYRLERFLGQGGMARVYQAMHLTLERPCAIKLLRPSRLGIEPDAAMSFLEEARAAAALVHPHVVTIHTIGEDRGHPFIEMEFVEGQSLAALVDRESPFDPTEATRFMLHIAGALALAHRLGMIHRDIKPANVLVTRDRLAKLADFGLAKRVRQPLGTDGHILTGTPNFMAPELFAGQSADMRSDIYAMGVTYFQLLTGQLPRSGESLAQLIQDHESAEAPDIRDVLPELPEAAALIVKHCLANDPTRRYENAEFLLQDLRAAYGSLRSLGSLLQEALQSLDVAITGAGDRYDIVVSLPGQRRQQVTVEIRQCDLVAQQVIRISSICGPADERYFRRALLLNPEFPYGAVGIESIRGVTYFVMTNVYPRSTCDPEELRESVLGIASRADETERWLTQDDRH